MANELSLMVADFHYRRRCSKYSLGLLLLLAAIVCEVRGTPLSAPLSLQRLACKCPSRRVASPLLPVTGAPITARRLPSPPITARRLPSPPRHRRAASRPRTISARRRPPASMHALHMARCAAAQTTAQAPSWAPSCAGWAPCWARAAAGGAPGRAPGMLPLRSPRMMTTTARRERAPVASHLGGRSSVPAVSDRSAGLQRCPERGPPCPRAGASKRTRGPHQMDRLQSIDCPAGRSQCLRRTSDDNGVPCAPRSMRACRGRTLRSGLPSEA